VSLVTAQPDIEPDRDDQPAVDCSVLIPVLNEESHIRRTAAAMLRQRFPGTLEFIFADGGSTDRTRQILEEMRREDPRIRIVDNPLRNVASGLNASLAGARGQWVARMDAHADFPRDYLALGVERLRRGDTRWVSGPAVPRGTNAVSRAVALALRTRLGRGGSRKWAIEAAGPGAEVELDSGVFAGIWEREVLLSYGGWDEHWPRNSDSELAGRFLGNGERLVCLPAMAAGYVPRGSIAGLFRQYLDYGDFRAKTARRHPHTLRRSHLLPPAVVIAIAASLIAPRRPRATARAGIAGYAALLVAAAARTYAETGEREAALIPLALAAMHLGHGAGFLRGAVRHGPPLAALARLRGAGEAPTGDGSPPVFNPSLA